MQKFIFIVSLRINAHDAYDSAMWHVVPLYRDWGGGGSEATRHVARRPRPT